MCEFKIIRKNDGQQIEEEILVLSYSEENELYLRDILGQGSSLDSALILEANTLNQTCVVLEHPLIKDFLGLVKRLVNNEVSKDQIEEFQNQLEDLKKALP